MSECKVLKRITLEPVGVSDHRFWYGHGMGTEEELGAGAAFRVLGMNYDAYVIEWRMMVEDDGKRSYRAFFSELGTGNSHRWELGKPRTLKGLAKAFADYFNRCNETRYIVSVPAEPLPFPGEY